MKRGEERKRNVKKQDGSTAVTLKAWSLNSGIGTNWKLVGNVHSWGLYQVKTIGGQVSLAALNNPHRWFWCMLEFEKHWSRKRKQRLGSQRWAVSPKKDTEASHPGGWLIWGGDEGRGRRSPDFRQVIWWLRIKIKGSNKKGIQVLRSSKKVKVSLRGLNVRVRMIRVIKAIKRRKQNYDGQKV